MIPRERVIKAVTFGTPDRAPLKHNITGSAVLKHGEALLKILERYPDDFGTDTSFPGLMQRRAQQGGQLDKDEEETDEWGCVWRSRQDGILGQVVRHPLADGDRRGRAAGERRSLLRRMRGIEKPAP